MRDGIFEELAEEAYNNLSFKNMASMTSITLPNYANQFKINMFSNCPNLKSIKLTYNPTNSDPFNFDIVANALTVDQLIGLTFYVPQSQYTNYVNAFESYLNSLSDTNLSIEDINISSY